MKQKKVIIHLTLSNLQSLVSSPICLEIDKISLVFLFTIILAHEMEYDPLYYLWRSKNISVPETGL